MKKSIFLTVVFLAVFTLIGFSIKGPKSDKCCQAYHKHCYTSITCFWLGSKFNTNEYDDAKDELKKHLKSCDIEAESGVNCGECFN